MTRLIVGPSNAGKSTLIDRNKFDPVIYAFELAEKEVPDVGVVHYNLLHHALTLHKQQRMCSEWPLAEEVLFEKIVSSGKIKDAVVVVAPIEALKTRACSRSQIERSRDDLAKYPSELWSSIIDQVDLFALYEQLFDRLNEAKIPFTVLYSSEEFPDFLPSDRTLVHHNLRGRYLSVPSVDVVDALINMEGAEYQRVLLPNGRETSARGFAHLPGSRSDTFSILRNQSFCGRSVLDVGCALGDILFRAERYGATKLLGIDMNSARLQVGKAIGSALTSSIEFRNDDFLNTQIDDGFDDVVLLNVIHHVSDVRGFLVKAAALAKQRLVVEYPTFHDPKFQSLGGCLPEGLSHLPIMGVSGSKVDQTFVFTSIAIERMVAEAGKFSATVLPSPITGREISIFSRVLGK